MGVLGRPGVVAPEPASKTEPEAMSTNVPTQVESGDSIELDDRDVRALTEYMTVLPEGGDVFAVIGENGNGEHRVDAREGRCTCPDAEYRLDDDERCKHERRVEFATGRRAVPEWVDDDAVDEQLGEHVDDVATPTPETAADGSTPDGAIATDGGSDIIVAGDDAEVIESPTLDSSSDAADVEADHADDERPDDCECPEWATADDLACWACYRDGFETPATVDS